MTRFILLDLCRYLVVAVIDIVHMIVIAIIIVIVVTAWLGRVSSAPPSVQAAGRELALTSISVVVI